MKFSIITPSFNQLDWLRLCVASVRDQVEEKAETGKLKGESGGMNAETIPNQTSDVRFQASSFKFQVSTLRVEHIIQDAGSPGIEEFAREVGADFYRDGVRVFDARRESNVESPEPGGDLNDERREPSASSSALEPRPSTPLQPSTPDPRPYRIAIYCESDSGMYDAINRGLRRATGDVCAWLNSDEQYLSGTLLKASGFFRRHPSEEIVVGDTILLNEGLEAKAYRKAVAPDRQYLQTFQMNLHSSSLFFSRAIIDRGHWLGTRFKSIGDAEWVARLMDADVGFSTMPTPLSTFILGRANLSLNQSSLAELRIWRSELKLSRPQKTWIKWRNLFIRLLAGTYLPRRTQISIYTPENTDKRTSFPSRWLDFRFRV
jgi:glycosyltransferase involved in cell wall biosynthesis